MLGGFNPFANGSRQRIGAGGLPRIVIALVTLGAPAPGKMRSSSYAFGLLAFLAPAFASPMRLLASHNSSFEAVRGLAIQCHALDLSGSELLFASTHIDQDEKTKSVFQEQFAGLLLRLAVAVRTKFHQGFDERSSVAYVAHCGSLFNFGEAGEQSAEFSMKDICDKIIDAVTIEKDLQGEIEKAPTTLCGKNPDGADWELSIFVGLFAEAVLNWARDMDSRLPDAAAGHLAQTANGSGNHLQSSPR